MKWFQYFKSIWNYCYSLSTITFGINMWCILFCLNKKYVLVWLAPAVRTANDCVSHIQLQIVIFHFRTKGRPHEPKRMGDLLSVIVNVLHEIKKSKQAILYFFFIRVKLISYGIRYWNWIMKYWSKYYNYHAFHLPTDGKDEGLTQRKTTAQQSSSNLLMACACRSLAAPHCQGFSCRWTSAHQSCCRRIRTAGGCCSTPAVGFWGWDTAFLFLSRETIGGAGLCVPYLGGGLGRGKGHTWLWSAGSISHVSPPQFVLSRCVHTRAWGHGPSTSHSPLCRWIRLVWSNTIDE